MTNIPAADITIVLTSESPEREQRRYDIEVTEDSSCVIRNSVGEKVILNVGAMFNIVDKFFTAEHRSPGLKTLRYK